MTLENGRDIVRSVLLLGSAAVTAWVDRTTGAMLVAGVGLLILQSAFSGWCPADLFLRPLGLRSARDQVRKQNIPSRA